MVNHATRPEKYDVVILGGGLAGLALALQLKQAKTEISILVLEKRQSEAPVATHKVGESTSELAASYFRDVLNLNQYLDDHQLLKFGLRFFFSPEHSNNISKRVEIGTRTNNFYPTHQLDRGLFENELVQRVKGNGTKLLLGARVTDVTIAQPEHTISFQQDGVEHYVSAGWVVDSTGRSGFFKRKFNLEKDIHHNVHAAWFRVGSEIDIQHWSDNVTWQNHVAPGLRRLATNHLMGAGYWVWIIPLVSGSTSIGIVADPVFHPFETYNTFEKAMSWLQDHEPLAAEMLSPHKEKRMDFKVMKNFAYDSTQFFSIEKWAVTGEAGAFMDPFYSPGSDFIALNNTWITDLIVRDVRSEDIALRIRIYELAQKELLAGWILLYQNMYGLFGKAQVMLMKIVWDWTAYWAIPCVLFMNNGYTDLTILKKYSSSDGNIGRRFAKLNEQMQMLFKEMGKYDNGEYSDFCGNLFDLQFLKKLQVDLSQKVHREKLIQRIEENMTLLEKVASEIFRKASRGINGTPADMNVNPYEVKISEGKNILIKKSKGENTIGVDESIKEDIEKMWLKPVKTKANEPVF